MIYNTKRKNRLVQQRKQQLHVKVLLSDFSQSHLYNNSFTDCIISKFQDFKCRILKFQDLAYRILKLHYLACRILKLQDLTCRILKFQDLALKFQDLTCNTWYPLDPPLHMLKSLWFEWQNVIDYYPETQTVLLSLSFNSFYEPFRIRWVGWPLQKR